MKKLKILWFGLVPLAWIACHWLWVTAGRHLTREPSADAMWWVLTSIFGSLFLLMGSVTLAIYLQD